jgi:casein kinase I family protein HRR25
MDFLNKKYKIIEKIGEGSFGIIFKGQNIRTNEYVAIKVEPIQNEFKLLKNESVIYQYLNNTLNVPSVKWFGKDLNNYYMVINLLGESLQTLKNKHKIFSLKFILQTGIQLIVLLKTIHEKGLIHRDIKPDNFLFGLNNERNNIYLIDFGFCKSYIVDGNHFNQKETHNLIGSKTYASINSHNFIELSRRDDMESLGYVLIFFYLGTLPWQNEEDFEQIKILKLCIVENTKIPKILVNFLKFVRNLTFEETPLYDIYTNNFKREIILLENK